MQSWNCSITQDARVFSVLSVSLWFGWTGITFHKFQREHKNYTYSYCTSGYDFQKSLCKKRHCTCLNVCDTGRLWIVCQVDIWWVFLGPALQSHLFQLIKKQRTLLILIYIIQVFMLLDICHTNSTTWQFGKMFTVSTTCYHHWYSAKDLWRIVYSHSKKALVVFNNWGFFESPNGLKFKNWCLSQVARSSSKAFLCNLNQIKFVS